MSYLDLPRIHFAGEFSADVSTINNTPSNFDNAAPLVPEWNPNGTHRFALRNCRIAGVADRSGALVTSASQEPLIGGEVHSDGELARMVDLDPLHQTGSQIWAHGMVIASTTTESVAGSMTPASMRDLWVRVPSVGPLRCFGGVYQTQLTGLRWSSLTGPYQSPALGALFGSSQTALSLRLVMYAYDHRSGTPGFRTGLVVGAIGPVVGSEPIHCTADRRLVAAGTTDPPFGIPFSRTPFNTAPFKLDGRRLVIDLGNALPEVSPGGGRVAVGTLQAEIVHAGRRRPEVLGTIPNDIVRYRTNAGIEQLTLTAAQAQALARRPLRIRAGAATALAERTNGRMAAVSESVVRLNPRALAAPGDPNLTLPGNTTGVEIVVTEFGRPLANAPVLVGTSRGSALTGLSVRTAAGLLAGLPATVTTGADGRLRLTLVAGNPGTPRPHVDGAVSFIGVYLQSATRANQHAEIAVRVYGALPLVTSPTYADVRDILTRYGRLYPGMRPPPDGAGPVDLRSVASMRPLAPALLASILRDFASPSYMPVTRDLSADATRRLADWLRAGAP